MLTMPCISLGEWQASETPGFLWDNVAAGGVLATNVFFNIAVLRLATLAAGCPAPEDVDEDQGVAKAAERHTVAVHDVEMDFVEVLPAFLDGCPSGRLHDGTTVSESIGFYFLN